MLLDESLLSSAGIDEMPCYILKYLAENIISIPPTDPQGLKLKFKFIISLLV